MSQKPTLSRRFTPSQLRYLAVGWAAFAFIIGGCAFVLLFWALGGIPRTGDSETIPIAEEGEPTATAEPKGPEEEGVGGGGEGVPTETPAEDPPTEPTEPRTGSETGFGYGVQVLAVNTGDPTYWMGLVASDLKFNWIKHQIEWGVYGAAGPDQFDWSGYDPMMAAASERGLFVMLSVIGAPEWSRALDGTHGPPDEYQLYADFLTTLINRYPGQIHAIEVWNEQNLDRDWHAGDLTMTQADANEYIRLLSTAHAAIKAANPDIIVISGALSPTGGWTEGDGRVTAIDDFTYLQWMADAGLRDYADCVGVHHNGINMPPDMPFDAAPNSAEAATWEFSGPARNPHHSWSMYSTITGYREIVGDMELCITEFGWPSREGLSDELIVRDGFEFATDNSQEEQAAYVVRAFEMFRELGYVRMAFLFNLNLYFFSDPASSDNVYWSLLDSNGAPRPVFSAIQQMPKP